MMLCQSAASHTRPIHHSQQLTGRTSAHRRPLPFKCCCSAPGAGPQLNKKPWQAGIAAGLLAAAVSLAGPLAAEAAAVRLPPIDRDPQRCERAFTGNTIGQANAVSDKLLDLRECKLQGSDLSGKTLSGALLLGADLSNSNLREAVFSKAYAVNTNFSGADMTNAVLDRVSFDGADLTNVKFVNAVITGSTFKGANLSGSVFEDALIGNEDAKRLCLNPTLTEESRLGVGCRT